MACAKRQTGQSWLIPALWTCNHVVSGRGIVPTAFFFSIGRGASHARLLFRKSSFRRESYSFVYRTRLEGLSQQLQYHEKSHTQIFISYEKNMISPDIFNEYGILKYWRFKDDMLVLATSKPEAGAWFRRFRTQSDLFSMSCTACSRSID